MHGVTMKSIYHSFYENPVEVLCSTVYGCGRKSGQIPHCMWTRKDSKFKRDTIGSSGVQQHSRVSTVIRNAHQNVSRFTGFWTVETSKFFRSTKPCHWGVTHKNSTFAFEGVNGEEI